MSKYVYKDKNRKYLIYASDAVEEDRNKEFYCPNKKCGAILCLCAVDGIKNAYFRAKPKRKHMPYCPYAASNNEFDKEKFDETQFFFEDAIDRICDVSYEPKYQKLCKKNCEKEEVKKHPPRTIRQLYSMCKSFYVTDVYGNKEIAEMILDDRSEYRYPRGCFGRKLIESVASGKIYDSYKKEIYLKAPIGSKKYTFIMKFQDDNLFNRIKKMVYSNQDKIIVLCGLWHKSTIYNSFITEVASLKQIIIVK